MATKRVAFLRRGIVVLAAAFAVGSASLSMRPAATVPDPGGGASVQNVRVITANLNWGLPASSVRADLAQFTPSGDVILIQEAKNVVLSNLVDTSTWRVLQDTSSADRAGSAILVRRSAVRSVDNFHLVKGTDATSCPGGGILTRWMAVAEIQLNNGGHLVVAAVHLPPARCQTGLDSSYNHMATSVLQLSSDYPQRLIIGADWNKVVRTDPNEISARSHGHLVIDAPAGSIDGFMLPPDLPSDGARGLAATHSDHLPVLMTVSVPASF